MNLPKIGSRRFREDREHRKGGWMAFSGQVNGFAVSRASNRKRRSMGIEERVRSRIEQLCVFSAQNGIVRRDERCE